MSGEATEVHPATSVCDILCVWEAPPPPTLPLDNPRDILEKLD